MLLKNLINNLPEDKKKIIIKGLSTNSKEIKKDFIFFAIKGNKSNGERFIKEAIDKGVTNSFALFVKIVFISQPFFFKILIVSRLLYAAIPPQIINNIFLSFKFFIV